jgi:hypothetical protein
MNKLMPIFMVILSQAIASLAVADAPQAGIENHWFMMVTTRSTDSAREAEFNEWYDKIDIPDVLEVPGYMRARRGLGQRVPAFPQADLQDDEGRYVALYDIETGNMDKTIIDMLMASRRMEERGRSTSLLKVVERVYYRQYAPAYEAPNPKAPGKDSKSYLYLVRVTCCDDEATEKRFDEWYDSTYLPAIMETDGFVRATRYELYRVLMTEPKEVPPFLAVYEIEAESAEQALRDLDKVVSKLRNTGRMSDLYVEGGATMYLKINDVHRN